MNFEKPADEYKIKDIYMMDLSIDFCHVKEKALSFNNWLKDYVRTKCQLNFNKKDPAPTVCYYLDKMKHCI